eukprot:m.230712 g.230712  ORF g.230712 m.230712 type:complete len:54 (+) comp22416_c10_seq1:1376-1537(+)
METHFFLDLFLLLFFYFKMFLWFCLEGWCGEKKDCVLWCVCCVKNLLSFFLCE